MMYIDEKVEYYSNYLVDVLGISQDVVNFSTSVYGNTMETLENILYYFTGYNSFDQLENEE